MIYGGIIGLFVFIYFVSTLHSIRNQEKKLEQQNELLTDAFNELYNHLNDMKQSLDEMNRTLSDIKAQQKQSPKTERSQYERPKATDPLKGDDWSDCY